MVASQTSGELQLVIDTTTGLSLTKSSPKTMPAIFITSSARSLRRDDAHERLVGMVERRMDDVQMPLRHRDLHRLANDRARRMQRRRHVGELVEIVEVVKRAVAARDCRGRAHRARHTSARKRCCLPPILTVRCGIAGIEREFGRDWSTPAPSADRRSMRTRVPLHIGAGRLPHGGRLIVAELAADFLEDLAAIRRWMSSTASSGTSS